MPRYRLLTISLLLSYALTAQPTHADQLRVWQDRLYLKADNKLLLVKQDVGENLRGYGMIDDHQVFLAYQAPGEAEAITIISIVDMRTGKEKKLDEIGGTGESFFDYNQENGRVVFNWVDGIYVFTLREFWPNRYKLVARSSNSFEAFWIDATTIGYTDLQGKRAERKRVKL
jgi:hypothetical protein